MAPPAEQAHRSGGASGINDFDPRVEEAIEADVHIAGAVGDDAVNAIRAAI